MLASAGRSSVFGWKTCVYPTAGPMPSTPAESEKSYPTPASTIGLVSDAVRAAPPDPASQNPSAFTSDRASPAANGRTLTPAPAQNALADPSGWMVGSLG